MNQWLMWGLGFGIGAGLVSLVNYIRAYRRGYKKATDFTVYLMVEKFQGELDAMNDALDKVGLTLVRRSEDGKFFVARKP